MKIGTEEHPIQSINWSIKNKTDLTVLLIPRLSFPSTKYKSLAKPGNDENSKDKVREEGRERRVWSLIFPPPFTR